MHGKKQNSHTFKALDEILTCRQTNFEELQGPVGDGMRRGHSCLLEAASTPNLRSVSGATGIPQTRIGSLHSLVDQVVAAQASSSLFGILRTSSD